MKVFAVSGLSNTGKTTTVCQLVQELRRRGLTVGTIKSSSCQELTFGPENCDSALHFSSGAARSAIRWPGGTAFFYQQPLALPQMLSLFDQQVVVLEGFAASPLPKILTGATPEDFAVKPFYNGFAISGLLGAAGVSCLGLPAFDCFSQIGPLTDLALEKAWEGQGEDWSKLL